MKKIALLIALIICLGCTFLTACGGNDDAQETGAASDSATEAPASDSETDETPDTDGNTDQTPDTDDEAGEPDDGVVEVGGIDGSKDAYADDIYSGVAPEVVG